MQLAQRSSRCGIAISPSDDLPVRLRLERIETRLPFALRNLAKQLLQFGVFAGIAQALRPVPEILRIGRLGGERSSERPVGQVQFALAV